jgi:N-acetylglucosaminyldiphosphoundecaprenol N-acetyl-beta-D-mannosaminyltransferase
MDRRANILGVHIDPVDLAHSLDLIDSWITARERNYVSLLPIHSIMDGYWDAECRLETNQSGLAAPDGMGLVWLLQTIGYRSVSRVYGADLMLSMCERGLRKSWRHFLFGGAPGTADRPAGRLADRFPGIHVVGSMAPPFGEPTPAEDEAAVHRIEQTRPDILWLGISSKKQIRWMNRHCGKIDVPIMIGVGAAFDFLSGEKAQAPKWVQRNGLEWLFRLASEPGRLWKRYAQYPLFGILVAAQFLGLKRFD